MLSTLTVLLGLVSLSLGAVFEVQVGRNSSGGLDTVFNPNQITAQQGDRVEFVFRGKNHTLTQSSFAQPCTQQFNTATNQPGVNSGFMPVAANATQVPVFTIEVMDATTPQWFFCNQANHCNLGMVFAINAPATGAKTFANYLALAMNATHPDPALDQTAPFTPAPASNSTGSGSSGSGSSGSGSTGSDTGSGNSGSGSSSSSSDLGGSEQSFTFGAAPTGGSTDGSTLDAGAGSGSSLSSETSATVFVGSIPASSATAVANAADTAPTSSTTTKTGAGFKMEPRNVLGMAILGAMSFALAW